MVAQEPMQPEMLQHMPSLRSSGPIVFAQAKKNVFGMEPAFTRRLQRTPVDEYRANYARFRKGKAQGAKGERPVECTADELQTMIDDSEDTVKNGTEMAKYEENMDFRMKYRRFRMGGDHQNRSKGDVVELSRSMSVAHARLLPVAQLSALMHKEPHKPHVISEHPPFHLHIGGGRLGMGLIVPSMLNSTVSFAILEKPFKEWDGVISSGNSHIPLMINGEEKGRLRIIRGPGDISLITNSDYRHLLVLTEDTEVLDALLKTATSFSTSLGPFMPSIVPMMKKLPVVTDHTKLPPLYGCENDHKMVEDLGEALKGRVELVSCMVDRICVSRVVSQEAITVTTEPYNGELVILHPPSNRLPPSFEGKGVRMPQLETQANYFCRRKLLLVNGTHTTLAFITLCLNQPPPANDPGDWPLIDWDVEHCGEQYHREIWAWAVARLLIILWEHQHDVLMHTHDVKTNEELCDVLLDHTTNTLRRFSSIKDTTSRVLGGGVANRWEGRLKAVDTFLISFKLDAISSILLHKANLRLPYIKEVVSKLCKDSFRFTGIQMATPSKVVCT